MLQHCSVKDAPTREITIQKLSNVSAPLIRNIGRVISVYHASIRDILIARQRNVYFVLIIKFMMLLIKHAWIVLCKLLILTVKNACNAQKDNFTAI